MMLDLASHDADTVLRAKVRVWVRSAHTAADAAAVGKLSEVRPDGGDTTTQRAMGAGAVAERQHVESEVAQVRALERVSRQFAWRLIPTAPAAL
jgi:hypothetical protein